MTITQAQYSKQALRLIEIGKKAGQEINKKKYMDIGWKGAIEKVIEKIDESIKGYAEMHEKCEILEELKKIIKQIK